MTRRSGTESVGVEGLPERLTGVHAPKQERSRRTLDRMAQATEALLSERGAAGVTVREVISLAQSSVGSFYARFDSKEDAVFYVQERFWSELHRSWHELLAPARWYDVPPDAVIAEVIRRLVRHFVAGRNRTRGLLRELLRSPDELALERLRALEIEISKRIATLLVERITENGQAFSQSAAEEGFRQVLRASRDAVLFSPSSTRWNCAAPELILTLTQMYAGFLGLPRPATYRELLGLCRQAGKGAEPGHRMALEQPLGLRPQIP